LHLQERYAEAAVEYREALRVWSKTLGPDHLLIATTHHNLGGVYEAQHDYAEAREHLERAWTLREHAVLAPADRGGTAFALATVLWALGQERSRALALAREARAEYERAGEAHATTLANVRTWLTAHDPDAGG
jgi:tetratricopeptide (TPR) repeat protein